MKNDQPETQFDFWLGKWDCTWEEDGQGSNRIEHILDGKIIQENFESSDLQSGTRNASCGARPGWTTAVPTWTLRAASAMDR
jgi:hypothetical protein